MKIGAKLIINTDSHQPGDLVSDAMAGRVLMGAGIPVRLMKEIFNNSKEIVKRI
jgi:histidinol phosphatase-like PHP family hydrolase